MPPRKAGNIGPQGPHGMEPIFVPSVRTVDATHGLVKLRRILALSVCEAQLGSFRQKEL